MENCLRNKSVPKLERKYLERNRRNHMKNLCYQLQSMLPTYASNSKKTTMTMTDQIDAAVNYIENLKMNLEVNNKHLEELKMGLKRAQSLNPTNEPGPSTKSPPQIEFHQMGQNMVMILITSLNNIATFNNIIRLCHEEGVEVVSTSFQLNGNSTLQISHETKVGIHKIVVLLPS
ncbi:hypothetical protein MTR67_042423 [Solanum verrucosum]|uniref:BHLH domain-containing protein n=1 Tax=Solanum verrucosum TaxID=315347 RepID=A0AAF0ZTD2_SOLVR|nr:hypothetical protein MTR67_042423 [Solanum verrucosum]